jgi:hypothetical protein
MSGTQTAVQAAVAALQLPMGPMPAIGRALQAQLQAYFPLTVFEHQVVPAKVGAKEWAKLTRRLPFIGLGWNDVEPTRDAGPLFDGQSRWSVFIAVENSRGIAERYFGDAQAPGLLQFVQVAVAVLHGFKIPCVGTVMVTRASNAAGEGFDENQAIAVIDISVSTVLALPDIIVQPDMGLFQQMAVTWNFVEASPLLGGTDVLSEIVNIPIANPPGAVTISTGDV